MATLEEVEESEWQKLPSQLQHQFYELADGEADKHAALLNRLREKFESLRGQLEPYFKQVPNEDWEGLRVAVVDGSFSPVMDTRLLGRYGVYCAGYHIYEGAELVDEGSFTSGVVFRPNEEYGRVSRAIIALLTALEERKMALSCAKRSDVDYVMVDGSFFGFVRDCIVLKRSQAEVEGFDSPSELVKTLTNTTKELLETGKAVGVIKRVRLRAIDGWLLVRNAREVETARDYKSCLQKACEVMTGAIDKAILSMIMPPSTWFSYSDLLKGEPAWAYRYYSHLAMWYPMRVRGNQRPLKVSAVLEEAKRGRKRGLIEAFGEEVFELISEGLERHYVKANEEAPACCIEAPRGMDLGPVLAYCTAFSNEDTGHPFPLDLIDDDVTLPRLFTREFVEEVEARLLERSGLDLEAVRRMFAYLNPQKKWRA